MQYQLLHLCNVEGLAQLEKETHSGNAVIKAMLLKKKIENIAYSTMIIQNSVFNNKIIINNFFLY